MTAAHRLQATWAGARDGLWDWDLARNEIHFSPRWKASLGYEPQELPDRVEEWFRRVHPADLEDLKRAIEACGEGHIEVLEQECRILHKNGGWRWFLVRAERPYHASVLAGSLTDLTTEKAAHEELLHEVFHDPLTGLANKALFLDRLELALSRRIRRKGPPVAVVYLDLQRFHAVNDSLGVEAGDHLLVQITARMKELLRPGDTLARISGDKFGVLLDGVANAREAMRFAEQVRNMLQAPLDLKGHEVCAQAALGIALSESYDAKAAGLLRDAITAMHRAKEKGSVPYEVFDPAMNSSARDRLLLEADLRRALKNDEFILHYQPIISLATGEIATFEALVRWQHPSRGMVRPDIFISIAEDAGLILPLGRWVLNEACREVAEWRARVPAAANVRVAVNLSPQQFQERDLVGVVATALRTHGLEGNALKLEVTESVLMERTDENARILQDLRNLGVRLSIDDFGTGYSSLACLHSFPLDELKIDRSFVMRMEYEPDQVVIVKTILSLARTLGLSVVAEGIETPEVLSMLRKDNCEYGQGFLFSNAIDSEAACEMLANPPRW